MVVDSPPGMTRRVDAVQLGAAADLEGGHAEPVQQLAVQLGRALEGQQADRR